VSTSQAIGWDDRVSCTSLVITWEDRLQHDL